jgi:nucleotide-binding universal stress UspA family protein
MKEKERGEKLVIPKIQRILYTTDLSENSACVFRYAIDSAKKHDASIIILHVIERMRPVTGFLADSYLDEEHSKKFSDKKITYTMDRIRKGLELFCDRELKDDPECVDRVESIDVCEGYPAEEILKKADQLSCDMIIMGTHGKGVISHTFFRSVAERVLHRARKPVFIIPLPKEETDITFHDI